MVDEVEKENVEVPKEEAPIVVNGFPCRSLTEIILYKMDRTIAVAGIILLGIWALMVDKPTTAAVQITGVAIGGLVTYIGGRTGK